MYRIAFIVITVAAVALGLVIGTLNSERVVLDLLWLRLAWPLGLVVLAAVAGGLLLGLLAAWFFSVLPLRARLRKAARNGGGINATGSLKHGDD